ncbi:hypothetical protein E3N88_34771 [Mikania micrantha]|uniref:Uncharacterized protein n=1 Tax=Mikania micrantha TaxID=192012 RepID=A0A5N6LZB6_9ASTR|nr:hypothetical protein E3N88_34771 [Mikania micrantha]
MKASQLKQKPNMPVDLGLGMAKQEPHQDTQEPQEAKQGPHLAAPGSRGAAPSQRGVAPGGRGAFPGRIGSAPDQRNTHIGPQLAHHHTAILFISNRSRPILSPTSVHRPKHCHQKLNQNQPPPKKPPEANRIDGAAQVSPFRPKSIAAKAASKAQPQMKTRSDQTTSSRTKMIEQTIAANRKTQINQTQPMPSLNIHGPKQPQVDIHLLYISPIHPHMVLALVHQ